MVQKRTLGCDVCGAVAEYLAQKGKGGAEKPKGWAVARYSTKSQEEQSVRVDLCPQHAREFEKKYLKHIKRTKRATDAKSKGNK